MDIITPAIEQYMTGLLPAADVVRREMEELAAERSFPIVGPHVGMLLAILARSSGARRVLELGSGFGYSAMWFARGMGGDGAIHCTDSSEENRDLALGFLGRAGHGDLVEFHVGDALETLASLAGPFDIIFNDIDKEGYPDVVEPAVERLRAGGLLITDNTLWKGKVTQADPDETTGAVLEFNRRVHSHPDLEACIVPIRDGVAVAARR